MRGKSLAADKSKYTKIPFSFLATLAGPIDGDPLVKRAPPSLGYISVTRTTKGFISSLLSISLDIRDEMMLRDIQSTLGFGRIAGPFYNQDGTITVKLIFNRTELQELLFPLFFHHGIFFLTETRRAQFQLALYIFVSDLTKFDLIPKLIPATPWLPLLPTSPKLYLDLPFFLFWIVGFTIAEGSFLFKSNGDACFQLKQRIDLPLFEAFKLVLARRPRAQLVV